MAMAEAKGKRSFEPGSDGTGERVLTKNKVCCYSRDGRRKPRDGAIQTYKETSFREKRKSERYHASTLMMVQENGGFKVAKTVNHEPRRGEDPVRRPSFPSPRRIELILVLGDKANRLTSDVVYSEKAGGESPYYYSGLKFKDLAPARRESSRRLFRSSLRKAGSLN